MHAGNLGHGILKARYIGIDDITGELVFGLLEEFILADQLLLLLSFSSFVLASSFFSRSTLVRRSPFLAYNLNVSWDFKNKRP